MQHFCCIFPLKGLYFISSSPKKHEPVRDDNTIDPFFATNGRPKNTNPVAFVLGGVNATCIAVSEALNICFGSKSEENSRMVVLFSLSRPTCKHVSRLYKEPALQYNLIQLNPKSSQTQVKPPVTVCFQTTHCYICWCLLL